jgi:hypothetical protein
MASLPVFFRRNYDYGERATYSKWTRRKRKTNITDLNQKYTDQGIDPLRINQMMHDNQPNDSPVVDQHASSRAI